MKRTRAVELLQQSKEIRAARFGVTHPALFGSTARDNARKDSDMDILVAFNAPHPRFARPLPASGERLRPSGNMEHLIWRVASTSFVEWVLALIPVASPACP